MPTYTVPNKETVRRISILNYASYCYILLKPQNKPIQILTDINSDTLESYRKELEMWCGVKFRVCNESSDAVVIDNIKKNGEKILPISFCKENL